MWWHLEVRLWVIRLWGWGLHEGDECSYKSYPWRAPLAELCSTMWGHREKMTICKPEQTLARQWVCWCLYMDILAPRTIRNICFFKSPSLWYPLQQHKWTNMCRKREAKAGEKKWFLNMGLRLVRKSQGHINTWCNPRGVVLGHLRRCLWAFS